MRLPRTIRLDLSDTRIFDRAAAPGEWAVPGSFSFTGDPSTWSDRQRLAFRSAWLGTESFGYSTLVEVAEIEEADFYRTVERLARHFVEAYGAPDLVSALPAARSEADYAASLCEHKVHTLLAIERDLEAREDEPESLAGGDDALRIVERIRIIVPPREADHARIWRIAPEQDDGS